jgi:RNA methyltransferase, TrmH family
MITKLNRMLSKSQIKYIQSLNQKKLRQENGVFIAEGPKILNELLATDNTEAVAIYGTANWWKENEDIRNEIPFVSFNEISNAELEKISSLSTPHQVLAIFKQPRFYHAPDPAANLLLLLDNIQDPGNLGTIIRIADWFAVKHIIAGKESADVFNAKAVQSTMGSLARVQVIYEDLELFVRSHPGIPVYATTLDGKPVASYQKQKQGMLLIGNESRGINSALLALSTEKITIPKYGAAESLNAAVATGIILSHLL